MADLDQSSYANAAGDVPARIPARQTRPATATAGRHHPV